MVATEMNALRAQSPESAMRTPLGRSLMSAAMALQLLAAPDVALADSAPERGLVAFKYLDYLDSQPGFDRIRVKAPSLLVMKPLSS